MTIAAVVLAAGGGSRWTGEGHKLLADFRGRPVASWAIDAAADAGLDELIVVTGAVDLSGLVSGGATVLDNPAWSDGQAGSLQVAVAHAGKVGHGAVVVGLADAPLVTVEAWRSVAATRGQLVVATFDGRRRPPVKVARGLWSELPTAGDAGARMLFGSRASLVVEVACDCRPVDIDTVEDLELWN